MKYPQLSMTFGVNIMFGLWQRVGIPFSLVCLAMALFLAPAHAQDAGSAAGQLWKDANSSFGSKNYTQAADDLQKIIQISGLPGTWMSAAALPPASPKKQWLEPVFFMLGAAHFNAKEWPDAIATFRAYRQLFPQAKRFAQVTFSLAQANLLGNQPDAAIPLFTSLLPSSVYHVKALLLLVDANKAAGKSPDSVILLEKEKTTPGLDPDFLCKIDVMLCNLYLDLDQDDKALATLAEMDANIYHVEDVTQFNKTAVRLGDALLAEQKTDEALDCYRRVKDNDHILSLQKQQVELLQRQRTLNLARIGADPLNSSSLQLENNDIDAKLKKYQQVLIAYQSLPPVVPPLYLRIGRAFSSEQRFWESAVIYREILRRYPHAAEAEAALYGSIVVFDRIKQTDRALAMCQTYVKQYPQGKYADSVGYLRGALAYDSEDFARAITYFNDVLQNQPNNPRREQIELILGDVKLRQQAFADAVAAYAKYESDYPQGAYLEQAQYRTALTLVFAGKGPEATSALQAYLQKYPSGKYVPDADYRLALIKFGAHDYEGAIADCLTWQQKHGDSELKGDVFSLLGDCYASEDKDDDAVKAYIASYKAAQTDQVLNYSLFAAAKLLQSQGKWTEIVDTMREFITNEPDNTAVVSAIGWVGRAEIKLGKIDEAKKYMADTAKHYINDPSREAVEEIITQLAQLFAHRSAPVAGPAVTARASTAGVAPLAAPNPAAPTTDVEKDLEAILTTPDLNATGHSRLLYAKAELARYQRKLQVYQDAIADIATTYKPEDLSPFLLGLVGDYFLAQGKLDQATPFYDELMDTYDTSSAVDYAYNGLGHIAYNEQKYPIAEKYFAKALNKGLAASKLKDITLGQAQTLLALKRPEEAKTYFEQVASNRAWRGADTALSVYSLGDVQMELGKIPEANAYYQRVFVAYQKYPEIQAKAYLKSGEAFEKMGKLTEAANTYNEMLKNPNLTTYPEFGEARQRLSQMAQK